MSSTSWLFQSLFSLVWMAPTAISNAQEVADEVRTWFITEYAPLWEDFENADPEMIKGFWADDFRDHPIDMDSNIWENSTERWQANIERYRSGRLIGSTVVGIQVEEISTRAVLIKTIWSDFGPDGIIDEPYCGTFIAGKFENGWKFTNYFTVVCSPE